MRITHFLPRVVSFGLSATMGAVIATLPVLAWYFGNLPLAAPISNLLAIPMAALLLPLGLLSFLFSAIYTPLAVPICSICAWLLDTLVSSTQLIANIPGASITFYTRSPLMIIIYFAFCVFALNILQKISQKLQPKHPPIEQKPVRLW
jgi:competence protein ComEC